MYIFSILIISFLIIIPSSYALTQDSEKILNNYRNYETSGSPPATSQQYSPNDYSPQINVVPAPKTNVVTPTSSPSVNTAYSNSYSNSQNNFPSNNTPPNSPLIWVGIVLMFLVFIFVKVFRRGTSRSGGNNFYTVPAQRRSFSKDVQHRTLLQQGGVCAICREFSKTWDADHKNGDRSDNRDFNCQMLCPNCHTYKSRKSQMGLD